MQHKVGNMQRLANVNNIFASIIRDSDDAIISKDLHGVITSWNSGAKRIFGYTSKEAIGRDISFLIPLDRKDEEKAIINEITQGHKVRHFQTIRLRKDGTLVDVSISISPILDSNGKVIGCAKIARDITEQNKDIKVLLDASQKISLLNEDKAKRAAELAIINQQIMHNKYIQNAFMQIINITMYMAEMRDPYTSGHQQRVGNLGKAIAMELGFDEKIQTTVLIAGYLHDIGKIIIPVEILCKPTKLLAEEHSLLKCHVQAGYDLINSTSLPYKINRPILEHHERLDGSGYPNQLIGDQISIEGRILAVADTLESMSSNRPYRLAPGLEAALTEIKQGRGSIYDEKVVDACVCLICEKGYTLNGEHSKVHHFSINSDID